MAEAGERVKAEVEPEEYLQKHRQLLKGTKAQSTRSRIGRRERRPDLFMA